jgi:uncharacterized protein (DUF3820 family)
MSTDSESDIEDTQHISDERMPFGKYKGKRMSEVVEDNKKEGQNYIKWVLKNIPIRKSSLQKALEFYSEF